MTHVFFSQSLVYIWIKFLVYVPMILSCSQYYYKKNRSCPIIVFFSIISSHDIVISPLWLPFGCLTVCYWKWPFSSLIYQFKMVIFQFANCKRLPKVNGHLRNPEMLGKRGWFPKKTSPMIYCTHDFPRFFSCLGSQIPNFLGWFPHNAIPQPAPPQSASRSPLSQAWSRWIDDNIAGKMVG